MNSLFIHGADYFQESFIVFNPKAADTIKKNCILSSIVFNGSKVLMFIEHSPSFSVFQLELKYIFIKYN